MLVEFPHRMAALLLLIACLGCTGLCQQETAEKARPRKFEVASIRQNESAKARMSIRPGLHGRFSATNATVSGLLSWAYSVPDYRIIGGPSWIRSKGYDIEAKVEAEQETTHALFQSRLQALLADRFKLRIHHESREYPIYELLIAKNGPKIQETKSGSCVAPNLTAPARRPPAGEPSQCGLLWVSRGRITGALIPLSNLTGALSHILKEPVLDKTGLSGRYDIHLEWVPDEVPEPLSAKSVSSHPAEASPADEAPELVPLLGPSLPQALQDQCGLKLESRKGPVDVIVIDHVERPSEN